MITPNMILVWHDNDMIRETTDHAICCSTMIILFISAFYYGPSSASKCMVGCVSWGGGYLLLTPGTQILVFHHTSWWVRSTSYYTVRKYYTVRSLRFDSKAPTIAHEEQLDASQKHRKPSTASKTSSARALQNPIKTRLFHRISHTDQVNLTTSHDPISIETSTTTPVTPRLLPTECHVFV